MKVHVEEQTCTRVRDVPKGAGGSKRGSERGSNEGDGEGEGEGENLQGLYLFAAALHLD